MLQAQTDDEDVVYDNKPIVKTIVKREIIIPKDPILAGLLSAQLPGVGQMYCGQWIKGGFFLLSSVSLYGFANEFNEKANDETLSEEERKDNENIATVLVLSGLLVHAWNIFDAYKTAGVYNRRLLEHETGSNRWMLDVGYKQKTAYIGLSIKV
jgi:hypothetical protein